MLSAEESTAHESHLIFIRLINLDLTSELPFAEICLDEVMQYSLRRSMKNLIS